MSVKANKIELSKQNGLTVEVVNGTQRQTIFLDGENLTLTVTNGVSPASTIEVTPTSVKVTTQVFEVDATAIKLSGTASAQMQCEATMLSLVPAAANLTSPAVTVIGEGALTASAPAVSVLAEAALTLTSAAAVSVTGPATIMLTGALVQVKGVFKPF